MTRPNISGLVIRLRATFSAVGCATTGVLLWFPHWRSAPSLEKFSKIGAPWPLIGAVFILAGVLIVCPRTRVYGYGIGSVLYLVAGWSLVAIAPGAVQASAPATVGLIMTGLFLLLGVATAQEDRGRRDVQ